MAKTAPGELELVRRFVNTADIAEGTDKIGDPAALQEWLLAQELIPHGETVSAADWERAIAFREAIRALAIANAGHQCVPVDSLRTLNDIAATVMLTVRLDEKGHPRLEPVVSGIDRALGHLLGIVLTAGVEGTWTRLKSCANDECRWVYYDRSKNRSGRWCSMEACGNPINARAYRVRRKTDGKAS